MNQILTCTDGSTYAPSIYDHTAWAARHTPNSAVHVLHTLDHHREHADLADFSGHVGPESRDDLLRDLVSLEEQKSRVARERGKLILAEAERHLRAASVGRITTEQQHGSLVDIVTRLETKADLVVMGKRGESADHASGHLGSNLERVIRASNRPVLVASREFKPIDRFLVAYDGGPSVEKAITFLVDHPLLQATECHLLRAGRIDEKAEYYLQAAAEKLRAAGYEATTEAIAGDPEEVIARAVETHGINLLVMGAYGHSRLRQLVVGSTTTAMVRTCHIPVLMFR